MPAPVFFAPRRSPDRADEPGWSFDHLGGSGPSRVRLWLEHAERSFEVGEGDVDHVVKAVVRMEERARPPDPDIEATLRRAAFHRSASNGADVWRVAGVEGLALGMRSFSEGATRFDLLRAGDGASGRERFVFAQTVFPAAMAAHVAQFALTSIEVARDAEQAEPLWTPDGRRLDPTRPRPLWEASALRDDMKWRLQRHPVASGLTSLRMANVTGHVLHAGAVMAGCEDFVMKAFETLSHAPWRDHLALAGFTQIVGAPNEQWVSTTDPDLKIFAWLGAPASESFQMSLMRDAGFRETEVLYHLNCGPDEGQQKAFGVTCEDIFNAAGAAAVKCAEWAPHLDPDFDQAARPQDADDAPLP